MRHNYQQPTTETLRLDIENLLGQTLSGEPKDDITVGAREAGWTGDEDTARRQRSVWDDEADEQP